MSRLQEVEIAFPRTPHLFGSTGTDDDRYLCAEASHRFLNDPSLIVEEKLDGANVGIHFQSDGEFVLQTKGLRIAHGMHRQYELFRHWAEIKRRDWEPCLEDRFILFGEWLFARHSIHYRGLPHYFFEFDIYDKTTHQFLNLARRLDLVEKLRLPTVPVIHTGPIDKDQLQRLIGPSQFDSRFENPLTGQGDQLMEGVYLRTEENETVSGRAKFVRDEFVDAVRRCKNWSSQPIVPNLLAEGVDIWL